MKKIYELFYSWIIQELLDEQPHNEFEQIVLDRVVGQTLRTISAITHCASFKTSDDVQ